jgi:hypothetical protein
MPEEQPIREWIENYLEEHFDCRCLQEIEVGKFEPFDLSGEAAKDFIVEINRRLDLLIKPKAIPPAFRNEVEIFWFNEAIKAVKEMLK